MADYISKRVVVLAWAAFCTNLALVVAQNHELPRRIPAAVAIPGHAATGERLLPQYAIEALPPTITVQAIEPLVTPPSVTGSTVLPSPESITASPPSSEIYFEGPPGANFVPPNAQGETVYYEGTPDSFPGSMNLTTGVGVSGGPCENCGDCQTCQPCVDCRTWQLLPGDIIYHSYLAGPKEPRFAAVFWHQDQMGWQLDYTVGGRLGILRYGNRDPIWPQGFQLDIEGAAFPRVNLSENMDLDAADYRVGLPFTYGKDKWQAKLAVYHLSAHVGDEYLIRNPGFERVNYVRDALVAGFSIYPVNLVRLYGEVEFAFHTDGGAKPWAFQFGTEISPLRDNGFGGDPFLAMNASVRQDVDFGGNFSLQAGWQWRGHNSRRLMRTGLHYLVGKSNQFEFYRQHEDQLGVGFWYDF
jgi:hypothetical protein